MTGKAHWFLLFSFPHFFFVALSPSSIGVYWSPLILPDSVFFFVFFFCFFIFGLFLLSKFVILILFRSTALINSTEHMREYHIVFDREEKKGKSRSDAHTSFLH